ncbi:hypothetical protein [Agromyces seonyuensis]|uniref:Bacterial spore germination immunoglobulin-like domain-containing protein n=1 Tax=Agromyces seonyuensis TaxID=2662446 RepID=A0A6I4P217_9MICO|nr:hypothetical protein [Agromyces seonyuensis]MWB99622.1 hypothetical protein [Agromyces seonyuensis]
MHRIHRFVVGAVAASALAVAALALSACTGFDPDDQRVANAVAAAEVRPVPAVEADTTGELDGVYRLEFDPEISDTAGVPELHRLAEGEPVELQLTLLGGYWQLSWSTDGESGYVEPGRFGLVDGVLSLESPDGRRVGDFEADLGNDALVLVPVGDDGAPRSSAVFSAAPWEVVEGG